MPGPPPKPADQRRRRNATVPMVQLPQEGYRGSIPEWPLDGPDEAELDRWMKVWRHPAGVVWLQQRLEFVVARYVRDCVRSEHPRASAVLKAEVRQMEDRLGLSPMAMTKLRWEVAQDELQAVRNDEARQPAGRTRRLRAVDDPEAANG